MGCPDSHLYHLLGKGSLDVATSNTTAFLCSDWLYFLWHGINEFAKFVFDGSQESYGGNQFKAKNIRLFV